MLIDIEKNICLGISHSGAVMTEGSGILELEDNEVSLLVNLIREKKTSDVRKLGIKESYPDLYEKLCLAYHEIACRAEEHYWLWEGYYNGYFEYDEEELKLYCKEYCGFFFEYNEDDYIDENGELDTEALEEAENKTFSDWLDEYLKDLDDEHALAFFYDHMNASINLDDVYFEVEIPKVIVDMAKNA